ncbi:hypothetical protein LguiA_014884 [Lonicera macranthoides]
MTQQISHSSSNIKKWHFDFIVVVFGEKFEQEVNFGRNSSIVNSIFSISKECRESFREICSPIMIFLKHGNKFWVISVMSK